MLIWPDTVCGRAVEDRNLLREAQLSDDCAGAMLELLAQLYPCIYDGDYAIVNPITN